MKKTFKIKTRILASVLSVITAFSAGLITTTGVYAAETNGVTKVTYDKKSLYYSDDYFRHSSTEYDPHLATLSCIMTNYSAPLDNPSSTDDQEWYSSQPKRLSGFFNAIGFKDFQTNEDYKKRTAFDTIGVAAASKKVDDCTVIGVGIRSGGYFREWSNNVYLGDGSKSDYMHEGWYNAANKAIKFIDDYVSANNIKGKVKIWIAGFSRGGATTNLAAGLLDNKLDKNEKIFSNGATLTRSDLYAYTFEAPQGANYNSETVKKPGDPLYNNIFNVVNPNDLVPKVAMSEYGFTRFGIDKFITTKFYDPSGFENNRKTMKALYVENGSKESSYNADDFQMFGTPLKKVAPLIIEVVGTLPVGVADICYQIKKGENPILEKDNTKANYDANIASYLLLEELTKNIGSRSDYCKIYQKGVSDFLLLLKNDVDAIKEEELQILLSKVLMCAAVSTIPGYAGLSKVVLKDVLPDSANSDKIINAISPLLSVVAKVYWERPNEFISMGMYIKEVFLNHDNDVNIAHLEAQDNYYIDAYNTKNNANLSLVKLRESADFGRVTLKDYNDIGLYDKTGSTCYVSVDGAKAEKSKIKKCSDGYAVGYYSYATEDGIELFMPVNNDYILNMKGFSIKPYHTVEYNALYQSLSSNSAHRYTDNRGSHSDWFCGNTDFLQRRINMDF